MAPRSFHQLMVKRLKNFPKRLFVALFMLNLIIQVLPNDEDNTEEFESFNDPMRSKRQINSLPLVYPYGGTYRFILGVATPIHMEDKINLAFAANFLYQYVQFTNITQLSQYYSYNTISRDQRSAEWDARRDERLAFYTAVEEMLNIKGFSGRECVLRAICEAAQFPVRDEGLVGEILHILLTPNYGRSPHPDTAREASMSDYTGAYAAGRQMFSCSYIYSGCWEGEEVLSLISTLRDD